MDKKPALTGKTYLDYLADEERINGPKRKAKMDAAIAAKKARKAAGIDITKPFKTNKHGMHTFISSASSTNN